MPIEVGEPSSRERSAAETTSSAPTAVWPSDPEDQDPTRIIASIIDKSVFKRDPPTASAEGPMPSGVTAAIEKRYERCGSRPLYPQSGVPLPVPASDKVVQA